MLVVVLTDLLPDATTGYLYWWNKPDGKVLGAISLADTILTQLPAPEFCFRLSRQGRFRDLRADSASSLATWVKHLTDEIAARSSGAGAGAAASGAVAAGGTGVAGAAGVGSSATIGRAQLTKSNSARDVTATSPKLSEAKGGGAAAADDSASSGSADQKQSMEAEILVLKQRVKELETKNARLEERGVESGASKRSGKDEEEEEEDAKAAELLKTMNLGGDESLRDQLEDLSFQLKACQKRLKAANETIKKQAQRIQLLEGKQP